MNSMDVQANKRMDRNKVLAGVYDSSWKISMLTLCVIIALEAFMLVYTFLNPELYGDFIGRYRCFYIALLVAAVIYICLYKYAENDIKHRSALMNVANPVGAVFFFAWSLLVTYSDFSVTGVVDATVFMTFSLMIPLSFYVLPGMYLAIALTADVFMLHLIATGTGSVGQIINVSIFIVFQVVLGISFLRLKMSLSERIVEEQRNAVTDILTGFSNRRAYEQDLSDLSRNLPDGDLTYVVMDINGLKDINDTYGHEAGDVLIIAAAECAERSFGSKARTYRIGGDEFVALLTAGQDECEELLAVYDKSLKSWSEENDLNLSVSHGFVCSSEFPDYSLADLAREADKRMYASKARYYQTSGLDRRKYAVARV